jgi:Galactose oxidase, central domain
MSVGAHNFEPARGLATSATGRGREVSFGEVPEAPQRVGGCPRSSPLWGFPMLRAIPRIGLFALVAALSFGAYWFQRSEIGVPASEVSRPTPAVSALAEEVSSNSRVERATPFPLTEADAALTRGFPQQSAEVTAGTGFVRLTYGFRARGPEVNAEAATDAAEAALSTRARLQLELPARGEGAATLSLPTGLAVEVRERGAGGPGRVVQGAVAYGRAGGTSYWRTTDTGYEEWLLLADAREGPVAQWEVQGGRLEQDGDDVVVTDAAGQARLRVAAPRAYGLGGQEARAWLRARGQVLALYTSARGRALVDPIWTTVGSMATARVGHTATLLPSGKVLVAGSGATAELYDPATGTWSPTGKMTTVRSGHTATLLPSGKVLVAGGRGVGGGPVWNNPLGFLATAELYDPEAGTWTSTGSMTTRHLNHTATLLPSGKVLVAGGYNRNYVRGYDFTYWTTSVAELYDPEAGTWSATGSMSNARGSHTATLLTSGKVLVAAGYSTFPYGSLLDTAELYDATVGTWIGAGSIIPMRAGSPASSRAYLNATLVASGKVLFTGGDANSPQLYDPSTGSSSATGSMLAEHYHSTATLLPSGDVLVASGEFDSAELYAVDAGTWSATGSLATARYDHTATLLVSGQVLVTGGIGSTGVLASSELYGSSASVPAISPSMLSLAPRQSQTFTASGGSGTGYVWAFVTNASGASLNAVGVYTAGATGDATDVINVTDSLGAHAKATVMVTSAVAIDPSSVTLDPLASQAFTASGGSGTGYVWAFITNASGGTLSADGVYTAGATNHVTDVVSVTDSLGNSSTATVTVGTPVAPLAISPSDVALNVGATQVLRAVGGSGLANHWAVETNRSGGYFTTVGSQCERTFAHRNSSCYTAGPIAGVTDVIQVTDSLGDTAWAMVRVAFVAPPLVVSPQDVTLAPKATQTFTASGGSLTGYTWAFVGNASGGTLSTAGAYVAGSTGGVTDVVGVTDSLGAHATATVNVTNALGISPSGITLAPEARQNFTASGGSRSGYTWAFVANASGGALSAAGAYVAGSTGGVTDVVGVTDSLGAHATATVTVTPSGGCGATGGSAFPLLAFALLPLLAPRRRKLCSLPTEPAVSR